MFSILICKTLTDNKISPNIHRDIIKETNDLLRKHLLVDFHVIINV